MKEGIKWTLVISGWIGWSIIWFFFIKWWFYYRDWTGTQKAFEVIYTALTFIFFIVFISGLVETPRFISFIGPKLRTLHLLPPIRLSLVFSGFMTICGLVSMQLENSFDGWKLMVCFIVSFIAIFILVGVVFYGFGSGHYRTIVKDELLLSKQCREVVK